MSIERTLHGKDKRGIMTFEVFAEKVGSMVRDKDIVAIFHSIHKVMKAEKMLKAAGADFLLIPVPRQLASDCGLAIRYTRQEQVKVETVLDSEGLRPAELYLREGKEYVRLEP